MTKLEFSQRSIGGDEVTQSSQPGSCSIASEISSHNGDDHWHSDDNSSQASSCGSSTQPRSSPSSSQAGSKQKQKRISSNSRISGSNRDSTPLPPPVLVYHESARSIVFRDNMHRACDVATEQVASILVGSVPQPGSQSERPSSNARHGASHANFLSERPTSSSSSEDNAHIDRRRAESFDRNDESDYVSRSFSRKPIEMIDEDDKYDASSNIRDKSSSQSGSLLLDGVTHRSSSYSVDVKGFQPQIVPLPRLQLGHNDEFEPLILSDESQQEQYWTDAEKEVYQMLMDQCATVKTIKNTDWTPFLHRFKIPRDPQNGEEHRNQRDDIGPHQAHVQEENDCDDSVVSGDDFPYNSFVTSTTLLPSGGVKMRAYGTTSNYTTGVVFAMPRFENEQVEEEAAKATKTWSWPSGYSAKTEFNIDGRGELINGRDKALVPFSKLRMMNNDYVSKNEYVVGGRVVKGGLKTVPYNEVFLRVGGRGRTTTTTTTTTNGKHKLLSSDKERSFEKGVGLPVAIFCRTASFGHLFSLLRTRARLLHTFGEIHMKGLPLLMITPGLSIRVLTEKLQHELLKVAARHLNPFQNSLIAHKTKINDTDPNHMQTKLEELIDLDDKMRETLTTEELARIAGGFGATDDSVAQILRDAMVQDNQHTSTAETETTHGDDYEERHELQDIVNEGLAASVRASDYYTSRQLLILYSLVSSEGHQMDVKAKMLTNGEDKLNDKNIGKNNNERKSLLDSKAMLLKYNKEGDPTILSDVKKSLLPRPPPPPLDTDRLRSATNSDGLLSVLGAAQILKAMQDGGAKKRTKESWQAVEEWVEQGERNIAFRLASWRDQRAAQDDLEIAVDQDSSFLAFVSGKAISNRKSFALQLHQAVEQTDFNNMRFLMAIDEITDRMHSPCLRLELLQYVLGLDNRYSIEHVKRAVELAATCLNISSKTEQQT